MSLATRCTSCGTVFRVVQDQLKISDGWVRCGQCSEVFNAVETLFDIDRDASATPAAAADTFAATVSKRPDGLIDADPMDAIAKRPSGVAASLSAWSSSVLSPALSASPSPSVEAASRSPSLADDAFIDSDEPPFSDTDVLLTHDELLEFEKMEASHAEAKPVVAPLIEGLAIAPGATARAPSQAPTAPARADFAAPAGARVAPTLEVAAAAPSAAPSNAAASSAAFSRPKDGELGRVDVDINFDAPAPIEVLRPSKAPARKPPVSARGRADFTDARFDSGSADDELDIDAEVAAALDTGTRRRRKRRPEFLRQADQAARWKSRPAKIGLALLSMVAGVALGAQVTHHFRADVAARWPAVKPALQTWCALWNCNVDAPRAIDDIAVESTTLTQGVTPNSFKLAVMLRSKGRLPLTTPSVSITLTDLNGALIARKVMSPADFRVAAVMAPGAETALKATLSTPNARVTGYTVETFYP